MKRIAGRGETRTTGCIESKECADKKGVVCNDFDENKACAGREGCACPSHAHPTPPPPHVVWRKEGQYPVILSEAKNLPCSAATEILRSAQDDGGVLPTSASRNRQPPRTFVLDSGHPRGIRQIWVFPHGAGVRVHDFSKTYAIDLDSGRGVCGHFRCRRGPALLARLWPRDRMYAAVARLGRPGALTRGQNDPDIRASWASWVPSPPPVCLPGRQASGE